MRGPLYEKLPNTASADAPPPALLPYQQAWVADKSPLKIGEKSRRIGLTWAEAADDVLDASAEQGTNVFYISATQDMALEYIDACAMWARAYHQAASDIEEAIFKDGDQEIQSYRILFPNSGRRIVGLSSSPRNLRGKQGKIIIDEAAFHKNLDQMLKAAMAMLMWGDRVVILSTHNGADNPFAELIQQVHAGKRKGSVHRIAFREAVAQGLYQRVCLRRGIAWTPEGEQKWVDDTYNYYGDDAPEELDVVPSNGSGRYLALGLIEARMNAQTPVVRASWPEEFAYLSDHEREREVAAWCEETLAPILATLLPNDAHSLGEDFGRVSDLTVLTILAESSSLVRRARFVVELARCPYKQQEQIAFYIMSRLPRFRAAAFDATGNGGYLAERAQQKFGVTRVAAIMLSESFYREQMPRFKAALEDATLDDLPRDRDIRDDLRALQNINGVPKLPAAKNKGNEDQKQKRHGDAAISIFLAHYAATTMEPAPIEFTAIPGKQSRWDGKSNERGAPREREHNYGGGAW